MRKLQTVSRRASLRGFTLIELMVVIAIIGILMGILLPTVNAIRKKARKVQVANLISECELACSNFRLELQQYPWMKAPDVKANMLAANEDLVEIKGYRVYQELKGQGGSVNTSQDYLGKIEDRFVKALDADGDRIVDVWEQEIKFRLDPDGKKPVIWSCGENKIDDTNFEDDDPNPRVDPPDDYDDADKYPRIYYYLGDGYSREDDISSL